MYLAISSVSTPVCQKIDNMKDKSSHMKLCWGRDYKSYHTHGTVENKIESFSSRFYIFYDSMSSDCDL